MVLAAFLITCVLAAPPPQPAPVSHSGQDPAGDQPHASSQSPQPSPCPASTQVVQSADCKPASPSKTEKKEKKKHSQAPKDQNQGPTKTVVRNGSTTEPTVSISTPLTEKQASQRLQTTTQMLASTDDNLKRVEGRSLTDAQQDTVKQIKSYSDQARTAISKGDVQSAYNLASKAKMLSVDLAGH